MCSHDIFLVGLSKVGSISVHGVAGILEVPPINLPTGPGIFQVLTLISRALLTHFSGPRTFNYKTLFTPVRLLLQLFDNSVPWML